MLIRLALILILLFAPRNNIRCYGQPDHPASGTCIEGYWSRMVDWATWHRIEPVYVITRMLYQNPNVAENTAAYGHYTLDGVEGYIALLSPSMVGFKVWIRLPGQRWIPVRVVDSAAEKDMDYHARWLRSGGELSYPLAQQVGAIDWLNEDGSRYPDMEICLTESDPAGVCTGTPVSFTRWYLSTATFN